MDGSCDDIARSEFGILVLTNHKTFACRIDQVGTMPAQGFGCQRGRILADIERGGVELDEFRVSDDGSARAAIAMPSPLASAGLVVTR